MNIPPDKMYQTKKDISDNIMIALGGRAAEEIIFGSENITTGASSDLQKATDMAIKMMGIYGMDEELGLVNYEVVLGENIGSNSFIIERLKKQIDLLYKETKKILIENKRFLDQIAISLLDKEVLDEAEINILMSKKCSVV